MAIYVRVTATAIVKLQDPTDENSMQELEDNTYLSANGNELIDEDYKFEIEDED
jgi:hypothetical protein